MAVFRVNKTKDYTVMSNEHLKDRALTLKAKGLLSMMLSLPDDWDYSLAGLVAICKESECAVKSTIDELQGFGYIKITKLLPNQTESKRIEYVYDIFESKKQDPDFQGVDYQGVDVQGVENQVQLNTKESNTKEQNILTRKQQKEESKKVYGTFQNVRLTDKEYELLKTKIKSRDDQINALSEYIESEGKHYKSHYATLLRWERRKNGGKLNDEKEYF